MESLYPFLYAGTTDITAVLEQVRASSVAKIAEITALRQTVGARDGARLARCAADAAARFAAGGRLFAFGNGGSATDAQQLATMFLDPGPGVPPLPAFGLANDTSVVTALCNDIGVDASSPVSWPPSAVRTTSPSACPPAGTRTTWCGPSTRPACAGRDHRAGR